MPLNEVNLTAKPSNLQKAASILEISDKLYTAFIVPYFTFMSSHGTRLDDKNVKPLEVLSDFWCYLRCISAKSAVLFAKQGRQSKNVTFLYGYMSVKMGKYSQNSKECLVIYIALCYD